MQLRPQLFATCCSELQLEGWQQSSIRCTLWRVTCKGDRPAQWPRWLKVNPSLCERYAYKSAGSDRFPIGESAEPVPTLIHMATTLLVKF